LLAVIDVKEQSSPNYFEAARKVLLYRFCHEVTACQVALVYKKSGDSRSRIAKNKSTV
jgi:hypothetical protein